MIEVDPYWWLIVVLFILHHHSCQKVAYLSICHLRRVPWGTPAHTEYCRIEAQQRLLTLTTSITLRPIVSRSGLSIGVLGLGISNISINGKKDENSPHFDHTAGVWNWGYGCLTQPKTQYPRQISLLCNRFRSAEAAMGRGKTINTLILGTADVQKTKIWGSIVGLWRRIWPHPPQWRPQSSIHNV